jgi:CDP-diacylglycerol--glycerol-3-phosphate 3-phosphatidyltransferase
MFDKRLRPSVEQKLRQVGANLRKSGISADHLTLLGLVMAVGAAIAIANGALRAGFLLLILTAVPDVLDGAVAKASGTATPRGAFFDSVSDRIADGLLLGGVAWFLSNEYGGHVVVLPLALLGMSLLISYERAKAESLGFDARGGLMERAERIIALGLGLLFEGLLVPILWVMLALTTFTAVQRFLRVWNQATPTKASQVNARWRSRRMRTSDRTRVRRERWAAAREARRRSQ